MISIVITSFKEPHIIGRAIEAAMRQSIKEKSEIIVVAPDKETLDVAKQYAKKDKRVHVLKDPGKGKPTALNLIFTKARGEILVLSDGDVYMGENAVASLLSHMKDKSIGAATGRVISTNKAISMVNYWAYLGAETFHRMRLSQMKRNENVLCTGYLYAVRKNLVRSMPANTLADDAFITESIWKHGKRTVYEPKAHVYVHYPSTLIDWIKQKKRTAGRFYQSTGKTSKLHALANELRVGVSSLRLVQNPIHLFWLMGLMVMRAYLWVRIMFDRRLWRRSFNKAWERVESSKK